MLSAVNIEYFLHCYNWHCVWKRQSIHSGRIIYRLLIVEKLSNGREIISLLYDTSFFFQIALFLFIGLVVGYTTQRKNNMLKEQKLKMVEIEDEYNFLMEFIGSERSKG